MKQTATEFLNIEMATLPLKMVQIAPKHIGVIIIIWRYSPT
jgi:hypothetical protein